MGFSRWALCSLVFRLCRACSREIKACISMPDSERVDNYRVPPHSRSVETAIFGGSAAFHQRRLIFPEDRSQTRRIGLIVILRYHTSLSAADNVSSRQAVSTSLPRAISTRDDNLRTIQTRCSIKNNGAFKSRRVRSLAISACRPPNECPK